jgi:hypothetical protein
MTNYNQNAGELDLTPETQNRGSILELSDILNDISSNPEKPNKEDKTDFIELEGDTPDNKKLEEPEAGSATVLLEDDKKDVVTIENDNPQSETNKAYINRMVKMGIWQPLEVIETEDGEVSFEEANIDDEMFEAIVAHQEDIKKENLLKGKVEAEGISDFTKKLIEIEKNGGNVVEALKVYQTIQNPLQSIDISEEKGQIQVLRMYHEARGEDEDTIDTIIAGYKAKGVLDEKAEKTKIILEEAASKRLEAINQQAIDNENARKQAIVEYKKNLKEELKQYEINETFTKKILDAATKEGNDKRYEIDNIYNEKRRNPKEAAELAFFLFNKEEYLKQKTKEAVTKVKVNTATKFKFTKGANTDSLEYHNRKQKDDDLLEI